jgi:protein disulfide-isomerase
MRKWKYGFVLLGLLATGCAAAWQSSAIYDEHADARRDIAKAITQAAKQNRNIVLIFGANWCGDCHALHHQMQEPELASIIEKNYLVVDIDVGRFDKNLDVAEQYHVPLKQGIPALAVLDSKGNVLYAMDQGEFADARSMSFESIKAFFVQWEPKN